MEEGSSSGYKWGRSILEILHDLFANPRVLDSEFLEGEESGPKKKKQKVAQEKRLYSELKGHVWVICSCRPLHQTEADKSCYNVAKFDSCQDNELKIIFSDSKKSLYKLEHVFKPDDNQELVCRKIKDIATSVLNGYDICILAYGQAGTGNTYTIEGTPEHRGVNYRCLDKLLRVSEEHKGSKKHELFISILEIHNETLRDLLTGNSTETTKWLQADGPNQEFPGPVEFRVSSTEKAYNVLKLSSKHANNQRGHSHCLTEVAVVQGENTRSHLWLLNLAEYNSVGETEVGDEMLKEPQFMSLSAVGKVISARASKSTHRVISAIASKSTHRGDIKTVSIFPAPHIDLIEQILLHSEMGDLFRSISVSKEWLSCRNNLSFQRKFIHAKMMQDISGQKDQTLIYAQCTHWELLVVSPGHGICKERLSLDFLPFFREMDPGRMRNMVLGSSNGLLLCSPCKSHGAAYTVCNPLTRKFLEIPLSSKWTYEDSNVGFLCDTFYTLDDDGNSVTINNNFGFKVARWAVDQPKMWVEVFSSDTGKWKKMCTQFPIGFVPRVIPGNFFNYKGQFHWMLDPVDLLVLDSGMVHLKRYDLPVGSVYQLDPWKWPDFEGVSECRGALWVGQVWEKVLRVFSNDGKGWILKYIVNLQGDMLCEATSAREALSYSPNELHFRSIHPHDERLAYVTLKNFVMECKMDTGFFRVIAENKDNVEWSNVLLYEVLQWPTPLPMLGPPA